MISTQSNPRDSAVYEQLADLTHLKNVRDTLVAMYDDSVKIYIDILQEKVKMKRSLTIVTSLKNTSDDKDLCLAEFDKTSESSVDVLSKFKKIRENKKIMTIADTCFKNSQSFFNSALTLLNETKKQSSQNYVDPGYMTNVQLDTDESMICENNLEVEIYYCQVNSIYTDMNSLHEKARSVVDECILFRNGIAEKYRQIVGTVLTTKGNSVANGHVQTQTSIAPVRTTISSPFSTRIPS